jgi:RHS repeat-associated protein
MSGQTTLSSYIPQPGGLVLFDSGSPITNEGIAHPDWLGTKRLSTSSSTWDTAYAPFGRPYDTHGTPTLDYTGDIQDTFAGLYETPNRELMQNAGRWLTPDPAHASWNAYAYPTDPNTGTDPSGLDPQDPQRGPGPGQPDSAPPAPAAKCSGFWCLLANLFDAPPDKSAPLIDESLPWYGGERSGEANRYKYGPTYLRILSERMMGSKAADSQNARLATAYLVVGASAAAEVEGVSAVEEPLGGVYLLRDTETGIVMRTGRTVDLARRAAEHARDPILKDYTFEPVYRTGSYAAQRGLEQMLHDLYAPPLNKISPISPLNPFRSFYRSTAEEFLLNFSKDLQ